MEGVVYSTRIADPVWGRERVIMEIWIGKLRVCINEIHGAFASDAPGTAINHFGTFNLPENFCALVKDFVEKKRAFEGTNGKLFASLKERLVEKKSQHNRIV